MTKRFQLNPIHGPHRVFDPALRAAADSVPQRHGRSSQDVQSNFVAPAPLARDITNSGGHAYG
jgi:hypothetical protein